MANAKRVIAAGILIGAAMSAGREADATCTLAKMAELPVTMVDKQPLVTATINGTDALFLADSGAFYSSISAAGAAELKLHTYPLPGNLEVVGVGGQRADMSVARVKVFTLAGFPVPIKDIEFLVGGTSNGDGSIGILGQNVFRIGDVEYDLANGVIRLMHEDGCKKAKLAYWVRGEQTFSEMDIQWTTPQFPHTTGIAYVNGTKIRVTFDTGAYTSVLSLRAAERAGIKIDSPGVADAGMSFGLGRAMMRSWIAPFASFKIGDEEIRNTHLRISDAVADTSDMLIGADFFLSHRIYVASEQRKLYFTYNGGPVFNLTAARSKTPPATPAPAAPAPAVTPSTAAAAAADSQAPPPGEPTTASEFSRRGNAFASRRDFSHALADLTRACELAPQEPDYFYERAKALLGNQQPIPALADLDQALRLKPDHIPALLARAELRLGSHDAAQAADDLDAADRASAKEADARFAMAFAYFRADRLPMVVAELDLWIPAHRDDARMPDALNERCLARALSGVDLAKALDDCQGAVSRIDKKDPRRSKFLENRALARLRLGDYDKSIADYDAALALNPKSAEALYGRGIDKLRRGKSGDGQADLAAAIALRPHIAAAFEKHGIAP